jgi:hypothetical protein
MLFVYQAYRNPAFVFLLCFLPFPCLLQIKQLLQLRHGILWAGHGMPYGPAVGVNLVVVAALERLVAKEVDSRVLHAAGLLGLVLEVLQAVCLVPAGGEDVERDLPADGEPVIPSLPSV